MIESKSLLAKLMATENLIVEQKNVQTASFDVKNRVLTIPTLNNDIQPYLYDLFVGHEVSHALYTKLEDITKSLDLGIKKSILNVVEDSRIERKIKDKYPGLKFSFIKGYRDLWDRDFFGVKDIPFETINLIDRINLVEKVGAQLQIKFNEKEQELLNEVRKTKSFDDVVIVSKKIQDYMQEQLEEQQKMKESEPDDQEDQEDDFDENDEKNMDLDSDYGDSDEDTEESDSENGEENESLENDFYEKNDNKDDPLKSFTDEALNKNQKTLFENSGIEYDYYNIPEMKNVDNYIMNYKTIIKQVKEYERELFNNSLYNELLGHKKEKYLSFKKNANKIVNYMVKEFELRKNADQLKKASTSKTGDLNLSKIFSYKFNEDIFKKISIVPQGKSHGLVLFLDWSGSMVEHLHETVKQLLYITMFCKKVNIPFEVYGFSDRLSFEDIPEQKEKMERIVSDIKENDIVLDVVLLNFLSSKMNMEEYTYMSTVLLDVYNDGTIPNFMRLTGTPLNDAIIVGMRLVNQFKSKNNLQIVNTIILTDGEGNYLRNYYDANKRSVHMNSFYSSRRISVLRDPVSKIEIKMPNYGRMDATSELIKGLKKITDSHVIGFYLVNKRYFKKTVLDFTPPAAKEYVESTLRNVNHSVVTSVGFDEYYILKITDLENEEFEVEDNASKRKLITAFSKYNKSKLENKVVLNKFIKLIA